MSSRTDGASTPRARRSTCTTRLDRASSVIAAPRRSARTPRARRAPRPPARGPWRRADAARFRAVRHRERQRPRRRAIITLASTTGANLFAKLWPSAFATADGSSATSTIVLWFVLVLAVTMTVSVLGHELIMKVEVWISWVTGVMTVAFLGFMLPKIQWSHLGDTPAGGPLVFIGGIIMAMTLVGIGFLNYGGDCARYLPRDTPARGVISWTVAGLSLPVVTLLAVGALLVGGDPEFGAATASDPIGALTALLPMWFFVPFSGPGGAEAIVFVSAAARPPGS
ncbi:hypothetical protein ACI2L4_16085 [Streptomyces sparsogenes]|uniref:hypothetical protein n=1 Tax=Streptomyces sparsogenes TaxID=67365 RepID=UPI00384ABD5D